jgi:hypothetical protein
VLHKFPIRPEFIELLIGLAAGAALLAIFSRHPDWLERTGRALRRTARREALWIVVAALLGPSIRLALLPILPIPILTIHDEFVHLLAADTLLQGRLANPPHPYSDHFETIYVLQKPTYAAGYPPGIGATLAAGWKLTGDPWFGVWMAMVLCCGSIAWLQYRWSPPLAAWAGSLLFSLAIGISSLWMNTYWGGAVPGAGGALAFGALPGLLATARLRYVAPLAAGWTLIWFARPYESVIVGAILAAAVFHALWTHRGAPTNRRLVTAALALGAVAAVDFGASCYQNWKVTGAPFVHPYQLTQKLYGVPQAFLWQREIPEPAHVNRQQMEIYIWQRDLYRDARSLKNRYMNFKRVWAFYLGYPLSVPLLIALFGDRSRRTRRAVWIVGVCLAWSLLYWQIVPHYVAAVAGLLFALVSRGLLRLAHWRVRALPLGACLACAFWIASALTGLRSLHPVLLGNVHDSPPPRAVIARQLESSPGRHLVFVRFGDNHDAHVPWIYNRAAIDQAKVVWAYDLGRARNEELKRYFSDRDVWWVDADGDARLKPYPDSGIHTR